MTTKPFGNPVQLKRRMQHPEFILQRQISQYLSVAYPKVLFLSDTVAFLKLTAPQQIRNKQIQKQGFKTPDLLILEPKKEYSGLFIELKVESPFKKDGTLKKNEHLEAQQKTIDELNEKGYIALFSWGFERTKKVIDWYLRLG